MWCLTGDETKWTHAPFAGDIADGVLYGRGAVDMKGGIACLRRSSARLSRGEWRQAARVDLVPRITGDEEGVAVNGTIKLLKWAAARGEKFDNCILGEPTNPARLCRT